MAEHARNTVDAVYRSDSRHVLATLIRLLGDFDIAEEALHDAFRAALEQWPRDGVPANPRAWLVSTGRFKAIDGIRRRTRFEPCRTIWTGYSPLTPTMRSVDDESIEDDRLRLMFTCCHPALSPDAQVALTLREVCGLRTEEIASAFLPAYRRWRSGSCAPRRRYETQTFPIRYPRRPIFRTGSKPSCESSTWCSTRDIRHRPVSC